MYILRYFVYKNRKRMFEIIRVVKILDFIFRFYPEQFTSNETLLRRGDKTWKHSPETREIVPYKIREILFTTLQKRG